ncbi:hypothetical protein POM88_035753 [Heracleum sosnowskyi]|uniref:ER membrane protein complex subunit 6 n=1 Tax=Heracleum sosnowskyi TaxID=360622 RepID=A0AAD8MDK3_9APIA|nr:hypothetical protein POM88_035753 [Heracleum sosnowskyi]
MRASIFDLTKKEKDLFCSVLKNSKLPYGCASNISRYVHTKERKVVGYKSHDAHFILHYMLQFAVKKTLKVKVALPLIRLGAFLRGLWSKVIDLDDIKKLQEEIVEEVERLIGEHEALVEIHANSKKYKRARTHTKKPLSAKKPISTKKPQKRKYVTTHKLEQQKQKKVSANASAVEAKGSVRGSIRRKMDLQNDTSGGECTLGNDISTEKQKKVSAKSPELGKRQKLPSSPNILTTQQDANASAVKEKWSVRRKLDLLNDTSGGECTLGNEISTEPRKGKRKRKFRTTDDYISKNETDDDSDDTSERILNVKKKKKVNLLHGPQTRSRANTATITEKEAAKPGRTTQKEVKSSLSDYLELRDRQKKGFLTPTTENVPESNVESIPEEETQSDESVQELAEENKARRESVADPHTLGPDSMAVLIDKLSDPNLASPPDAVVYLESREREEGRTYKTNTAELKKRMSEIKKRMDAGENVDELIVNGKSHGPDWLKGRQGKKAALASTSAPADPFIGDLTAKIRQDLEVELEAKVKRKVQDNMAIRTFMSIIGGVIAGVLGFTSLMGFVFYFLVMAITSVGLAAKAGFSVHSYFDSWNRIILDGFLGGLMDSMAIGHVGSRLYLILNSYRDSIIFMWYLCLGSAQKIKENTLKGYWYSSTCPMAIVNHLCSGGISLALENY